MSRINFKIINGDALVEMPKLARSSVDFILTDLPYGQTAQEWDKPLDFLKMWKGIKRVAKPNAGIALFGSGIFSAELICSNSKNYKHKWYWWKNRASNFLTPNFHPMSVIEEILVFSFGTVSYYPQKSQGHTPIKFSKRKANSSAIFNGHGEYTNNAGSTERFPTNVLMFDSVDNNSPDRVHTNQKPIDLLQYLIRTYTKKGDTVLDITAGSFSTGVACALEKRNFIGIEIDPKNCEIGEALINRVNGNLINIPRNFSQMKKMPLFE